MGTGNDKALVVFGGFKNFPGVTTDSYQRRFTSGRANWTSIATYPLTAGNRTGATHMAQCIDPANSNLIYLLGGYAGRHPGNSINIGYAYNRINNSYSRLPNLPGDRAGGGCVVVRKAGRHMLVFAGGVDRVFPNFSTHIDHADTWTLDLSKPNPQWEPASAFKNPRNHMAGIEACGRYFFVGGQKEVNENTGNQNTTSEWFPETGQWSESTIEDLPYGVGHISASVMSWKCGLIVVGGMVNGVKQSDNVLYWNPTTNKWKVIGKYPHGVATPVCGISDNEVLCATGGESRSTRNLVYHGKITT